MATSKITDSQIQQANKLCRDFEANLSYSYPNDTLNISIDLFINSESNNAVIRIQKYVDKIYSNGYHLKASQFWYLEYETKQKLTRCCPKLQKDTYLERDMPQLVNSIYTILFPK
ncbi:hypothetical protein HCA00_02420 [Listeria booriae]|uniref:hypothetical protein n=1 Tax=Listeria booriae TaxID=1552123 RepID=UPI0016283D25|nr:hypothetical protein [Listeria booriae]MBC2256964.1 hypothetical protein [Listeria booriae]MBC6127640.1 hypothetical protein [Listeria booriae]